MICPNCNSTQPDNAKFCNNCGKPLIPSQAPQAITQHQPVPYAVPITPPPVKQIPVQEQPAPNRRKPWYARWWIWVILGVVSTLIISVIGNTYGKKTKSSNTGTSSSAAVSGSQNSVTNEPESYSVGESYEAPKASPTENPEAAKSSYINSCSEVNYKTLARNPGNYKGQNLKYTGQVIQVVEPSWGSNTTTLRVNVTPEENEFADGGYLWSDTIICTVALPEGEDRILENDIIDLYGVCDGLYTYETILGNSQSVPKIDIKYYAIHS